MPRYTPSAVRREGLPLPPTVVPATLGARAQIVGVGQRHAHILGGNVGIPHMAEHFGIGVEQFRRFVAPRIGANHRLAAAQRKTGDRRLERHAPRQPERVGDRRVETVVHPDAGPAKSGAERRVVDCDDGGQPAVVVATEEDLFMPVISPKHGRRCGDIFDYKA